MPIRSVLPPLRPRRATSARRAGIAVLAAAALLAGGAGTRARAASQQVPVGPRAMALGGAFSAIADDASALYWNPAGLPWLGHQEFAGSYANLFQSDIKDNHLAFVLPLAPRQAAGIDWYHSGFDDSELGFAENRIDLAYGARWRSLVSLGGSVKYLNRSTSLDGSVVRRGGGAGLDLGVLVNPTRDLRLGLVAQDLTGTDLHYGDGGPTVTVYPRNVRAGASYAFRRLGTLAFDLDDSWHAGAEVRPQELVALRAGVAEQRKGGDGPTWSVGAGLSWMGVHADFAYVVPPTLSATSYFGLSFAFNFNPSQVRIEKVAADDIYASLYKRYDDHAFGRVELRNLGERPIDAALSVLIPGTMDAPTTRPISLRPGATAEFPLTAVLSNRAMAVTGDRKVPLQVQVSYQSLRLARTEKARGDVRVYAPGEMCWDDGVAPAAAFITPRDPVIEDLSRRVVSSVERPARGLLRRENLANAAALFDAVAALGVRYVPDPLMPYGGVARGRKTVDTIYYPRQTLARRAGDCDDLTVLMSSLLGNVGIATQLVDVPGHILLMFDSGVAPAQRVGLGAGDDMTIEQGGRLWVPLEATALDAGFARAWQEGAQEIARQGAEAPGEPRFVDVSHAQSDYEPAAAAPGPEPALTLDAQALGARYGGDRDSLDAWFDARVRGLAQAANAAGADSGTGVTEAVARARVAFAAASYGPAADQLRALAARAPSSAAVENDLGDALFAADSTDAAEPHYRRARALDAADPGIVLNLGLLDHARGDTAACMADFAAAIAQANGEGRAAQILGLDDDTDADRRAPARVTRAELRALLARAARRAPAPPANGRPTRPQPSPASRSGGTRSGLPGDLAPYLYWKP